MDTAVKSAESGQKDALISTIVAAFVADPVARWTWPEANRYFASMGEFVEVFGGASFLHGSAYCVGGCGGAALWLPPNVQPNEEKMMTIAKETVRANRLDAVFSMFERMGSFHPHEPHWYLPLIGVDPSHQARGYGSLLM